MQSKEIYQITETPFQKGLKKFIARKGLTQVGIPFLRKEVIK